MSVYGFPFKTKTKQSDEGNTFFRGGNNGVLYKTTCDCEQLKQRLEKLEIENNQLKQYIDKSVNISTEMEELEAENSKLDQEAIFLRGQNDKLNRLMNELTSNCQVLEKENVELNSRLESVKRQYISEIENLKRDIKDICIGGVTDAPRPSQAPLPFLDQIKKNKGDRAKLNNDTERPSAAAPQVTTPSAAAPRNLMDAIKGHQFKKTTESSKKNDPPPPENPVNPVLAKLARVR